MDLYQCIFIRKSVRKYRMEKADETFLKNIEKYVKHLECLYPDFPIITEIVTNEKWKKSIDTNFLTAPYYLEMKAGDMAEDYLNMGYIMEQVSLYLTEKGFGSCFIGGKETLLLAFGKAAETRIDHCKNFFRSAVTDPEIREFGKAKRKDLTQLCVFKETPQKEITDLLEAARMAPSAWNGQPWRFVVYGNRIHIFCRKSRLQKHQKKETYIGMGAMLSHILLTAEELWVEMDVKKLDSMTEKLYENHDYIISILLK